MYQKPLYPQRELLCFVRPFPPGIAGNGAGKNQPVLPIETQAPCKRKAVFAATGKTIFSIDATYTNPVNAKIAKYAAEIQLNLTDGATYYVFITRKGFNDLKMELLSDKEAEKMLKDKKFIALDDYDEVN